MEVVLLAALYFLPSIVAGLRNHRNTGAICVTNLVFGWTILGWFISLIWACTDNVRQSKHA